jgi:ligand-binding sensor domain-containing protein
MFKHREVDYSRSDGLLVCSCCDHLTLDVDGGFWYCTKTEDVYYDTRRRAGFDAAFSGCNQWSEMGQ